MIDYKLDIDEVLLVELITGAETKEFRYKRYNIALTNKNIIFVSTGLFGKAKDNKKYPISDVKQYEGKAAIAYTEKMLDDSVIDISLINNRIKITVFHEDKKVARDFVNQLNKLVTGSDDKLTQKTIPGIEGLAESVKGSIDVVKKTFGIKPKQVVAKCSGCGVSITGDAGSIINCPYCGNANQL